MKINLSQISTEAPRHIDKYEAKKRCEALEKEIDEMQEILFASASKSLLIILQGMDGSGKDGVTKKVLGRLNPQGVRVKSFKKPTPEELNHDFLWRVHQHTPEKGMIQIFNRSHYEDVLVTRVLGYVSPQLAKQRFEQINAFESLLESSGTKVLKFYLHLSKEKQKEKFLDRLTAPEKHWKYNPGDWETRAKWDEYILHYEEVIENCNQPEWNIIPSDDNWYKELLIAEIIHKSLIDLKLSYPPLNKDWVNDIEKHKND